MKANPAHNLGTGRKKRTSTLPGSGISAAEKRSRLIPTKRLHQLLEDEFNGDNFSVPGMLDLASYNSEKLRTAKNKVDALSTPMLSKLAEVSASGVNGTMVKDALYVLNDKSWASTFKHQIENVAIDVAAYHHVLKDMAGDDSVAMYGKEIIFETVYQLTGKAPGALAELEGQSKRAVEALMSVVGKNGHFRGHTFENKFVVVDYFSLFNGLPMKNEFPQELANRIMEDPECSETLMEYMNKRLLKAVDVDWEDFCEYQRVPSSLREGAL